MFFHLVRTVIVLLLASWLSPVLAAQSEFLIWRYTYLNDQQFRMETGRLRAEGFVSENGANETYAYPHPVYIEQIKRISGQPLLPSYVIKGAFPGAHKNLQRSEETFAVGSSEYYVVRWFAGLTGRCLNVSTRAMLSGSATLIPGFFIADRETPVLVRAVGPGLSSFGITGMPNPRLQIYNNLGKVVAENDDWSAAPETVDELKSAMARGGAFPLSPESRDAAILLTLDPGTYTAHARASDGVGGDLIVEVYILDPVPTPFSFEP